MPEAIAQAFHRESGVVWGARLERIGGLPKRLKRVTGAAELRPSADGSGKHGAPTHYSVSTLVGRVLVAFFILRQNRKQR
jgi:hypothetical protein